MNFERRLLFNCVDPFWMDGWMQVRNRPQVFRQKRSKAHLFFAQLLAKA